MPDATFACPGLTTFCRLQLGLEVAGQRLEPGRAVLAFVSLDITQEDSTVAAVSMIEAEMAPIDVLVIQCGIVKNRPLVGVSLQLAVGDGLNLDGVFLMTREVGRRMVGSGHEKLPGGGHIAAR